MPEEIRFDSSNTGILTITFNRPLKRNAISQTMMRQMINVLEKSATDDRVKFVVVTGVGDFYSSGNDFSPSGVVNVGEYLGTFKNLVAALIDYPKLLVALVNGPAIGMACTTLGLFDIIYVSNRSYFQTPFSKLGLVAEGCSTFTFNQIFGPAKAAKFMYLNERMDACEAVSHGFVTNVFPHQDFEAESQSRLMYLTSLPLQSLVMTKRLVKRGWDRKRLHEANEHEVKALTERFHSEDFINVISNPDNFRGMRNKL